MIFLTWMSFQHLTSWVQQMVYPYWIHPFTAIRSMLIGSLTDNLKGKGALEDGTALVSKRIKAIKLTDKSKLVGF